MKRRRRRRPGRRQLPPVPTHLTREGQLVAILVLLLGIGVLVEPVTRADAVDALAVHFPPSFDAGDIQHVSTWLKPHATELATALLEGRAFLAGVQQQYDNRPRPN